jgi:hypothetical protein
MEPHELLYSFRGSLPSLGLSDGDLLIVEPRKRAASGELVVASIGENLFIGHWWQKHGLRELREPETKGDLRIKGVVNLIVRPT